MKEDSIFKRDSENLFLRAPVDLKTATLGGTIEVPSPDGGKIRISISSGTQNGKRFRLKGKGMPVLQGRGSGDLYVEAIIEIPTNLNSKQKKAFESFSDLVGKENNPTVSKFKKNIQNY